MKFTKTLLIAAFLATLSGHTLGFATIVTTLKGGDEITFNSNTKNIDVYLDGQKIGKMNQTFKHKLERTGKNRTFTFKKENYKTESITVTTTSDKMFWGNVIFGGTLGSSTDSWFTNNTRQYTPNFFFIELVKDTPTAN